MFESILTTTLTPGSALLCTAVSLILGLLVACVYRAQGSGSSSLFVTLMLLPALVQVVIMLVNGNLGAGVAVMGAFSLVRFRSLPGTGRDILCIFYAMAIGLATGMGYVWFAVVFALVLGAVMVGASHLPFLRVHENERHLQITIPENLDYTNCFDDVFTRYTSSKRLECVKTTNMGTMFHLTYHIRLKRVDMEKAMIDAIRCRNGNLTVQCGLPVEQGDAL